MFAKPRKIKYTIQMEVPFKDLVLLTKSIKTFREWVERFKSVTCTAGLSGREKNPPLCVYILKMRKTKK